MKSLEVNLNALFCRLVQQVHTDYHRPRNLQNLQRQSQIPLQTGGVRYHQRDVRLSGQQIVPCDLLLGAAGVEGVGPGQIDQGVGFVVICIDACGGGYGLARPVAGVLVQMGQSVENRGLSNVRIACQGDGRPRRGICCHRNHPSLSSAGKNRRYFQCMREVPSLRLSYRGRRVWQARLLLIFRLNEQAANADDY